MAVVVDEDSAGRRIGLRTEMWVGGRAERNGLV